MRIALAGNPNSGKTTMYNELTGRNEKVGNWAGVTVDKKEHAIKREFLSVGGEVIAVDLPGAYSMSPFTLEESITRDYIKNEQPDVIINIVDATNLSRSLFLTTQLLELGVPLVVALNKADINKKKETKIQTDLLAERLGCPVVETVSTSAEGLHEVMSAVMSQVGKKQRAPYTQSGGPMTDRKQSEAADRERYRFVNTIVKAVEKRKVLTKDRNYQDKIDAVLTNKWLGIPIFALVMFFVFQISQAWLGPFLADTLCSWLEMFKEYIGGLLEGANPFLTALLVDGVIGGVIAVIGFLPLVMVMYFLIALLEDCGYMARVSVVLDPIFKKVGLSGKSVIPFVMATGCAIPGVMACRSIRGERERRATAMLAPFMPCGAKLPVIALFSGVFFGNAPFVGTLMYFGGILLILFGALLVNQIAGYKPKKSYFIIELPEYRIPSLWRAFISMCGRGWAFIVKAATIILLCNTAVQLMQSFDFKFELVESADASILAALAEPFAYLLIPVIGILSWQFAAAAITGFIAKENVVGTLAVCFSITNFINVDELTLEGGAAEVAEIMGISAVAGLAYLMFNLFTPPCFAAIGAMNSEMKSGKWLFGGIALQLGFGFTVAYLVYQIGTLATTGSVGAGFVPGAAAILLMAAVIAYLCMRGKKRVGSAAIKERCK